MRNPMNRRLVRELKADLGKYMVIFLFIVMVVSVVSSFLVANAGVAKTYYDSLEKNRVENGHMAFNIRPEESFLDALASKAKIELYPADYFEEENDGMTLRVYRLGSDINLPEVTEGRLPERSDEIALDNLHSEIIGVKVGDSIPVDGHQVTVTGLVALPNYTALFKDNADLMFDSEKFGVAVMSQEGFDAFDSDHVTVGYAWRYLSEPKTDKEKKDASEEVLSALRDELVETNTEIIKRAMMGEEGLTMLEVTDFLPDHENKSINFAAEDMNGDEAAMA
ncbi:MAG: ABC transporter permease, partial [Lachnospiraceae bacterium]|nr:ABC transporter permease [Lachnospiraceae bacterium]